MKVRHLKGRAVRRDAQRHGVNEGVAVALRRYRCLIEAALIKLLRQEQIAYTPEGYERMKDAVLAVLPQPRLTSLHVTCVETGETFIWDRRA